MSTIRIEGSQGILPQGEPNGASAQSSTPTVERMGVLCAEDGRFYVAETGKPRIRIDDDSITRLFGTELARSRLAPSRVARDWVVPSDLTRAIEAARKNRPELEKYDGVVGVRAGYKFTSGRLTSIPCIVVTVVKKTPGVKLAKSQRLPESVDGVAVDVAPADPHEMLAYRRRKGDESVPLTRPPRLLIEQLQATEGDGSAEVARSITYEPPPGAALREVTDAMTIVCHVSPDAGWRVLQPFLSASQHSISLGMYDFTAPHIYRAARSLLRDSAVEWRMTLGPGESLPGEGDSGSTKAEDMHESDIIRNLRTAAGDRFTSTFAHVGAGATFASAYHIKVAVQDRKSFWLSSGNWQSSNQPDIDFLTEHADRQLIASYNREWHVVVDHPELAKTFQTYLEWDFKTASSQEEAAALREAGPELAAPADEALHEERAARDLQVFAPKKFVFTRENPVRIQPILTPDNYIRIVLDLLRRKPKHSLYFQNQSLNPIKQPTAEFEELLTLIAEYSNDSNLDVKIVFRNIGPIRQKLESLKAAGFNMERVRTQSGCHTKGIIVDSNIVLMGSHNFTNDGTQFNRDASLLINDAGIAKYYEDVFLHDWERLASSTIREESVPRLSSEAAADETVVRVPWREYTDED